MYFLAHSTISLLLCE